MYTEYGQGTFTSKLSRPQIFKIARQLPRMNKWREPEFTKIKERLKIEFELGNRDFSKATDIIKCHYNLAPIIGEPLPIKGISEQQLLFFFDEWIKENPEIKTARNDDNDEYIETTFDRASMISKILSRATEKQKIWGILADEVSANYVAGIESLFYFARNKEFVEYYNTIYEIHTREANNYLNHNENLKNEFMHIFKKTNLADNFLISLYALGQANLAERIITKYELENSFRWLDDARSGRLFSFPDFANY